MYPIIIGASGFVSWAVAANLIWHYNEGGECKCNHCRDGKYNSKNHPVEGTLVPYAVAIFWVVIVLVIVANKWLRVPITPKAIKEAKKKKEEIRKRERDATISIHEKYNDISKIGE